MNENLELSNYCDRYSGITRVFKQVLAATLMKQSSCQQAIEEASSYAESNRIYRIVKFIENIAIDNKIANFKYVKDIGNDQFGPFQQQADKLEKDIIQYKNSQNKLSTGLSYIELGNLYLQSGDVTEAFRSYERVFNYYEAGDIYQYHLNWSACMLIERRYDQLRLISPKEAVPQDRKKRQQHTTLLIFQALRSLYSGIVADFLQIIKECIQYDSIVEDPSLLLVSNLREIGILITMVALTRYSRSQVQELLSSDSIRFFVTQDDNLLPILEAYVSLDYNRLMTLIRPILAEYSSDFLFKKFTFSEVLVEKVTRLYLQPYKKISLQKVVQTLGLAPEPGFDYLKKLITNNTINFLYDPIDQVFIQKTTEKTKKYMTYENAVNTIGEYLRKKQQQMLRYQLSVVQHENFLRKHNDKEQPEFSFSKLSKTVAGFLKADQR